MKKDTSDGSGLIVGVDLGDRFSRACEPAEIIGNFMEFQRVTPWTHAVGLARSTTVTNRPASNSVPSCIIA